MAIYENVTIVIKGNVDLNVFPDGEGAPAILGHVQVKTADGLSLTTLRVLDDLALTELRVKEI